MLDLRNKKLLIISPHPDDEVLGAGGFISKFVNSGGKVYVLFLTVGATKDFSKKGVSSEFERISEIKKVARLLKFSDWKIAFPGDSFHLQLDKIPQKQIIHEIERGDSISLEEIKPEFIAFPFSSDYNQDHRAAAEACLAACRPAPKADKFVPDVIFSYEEPMDTWSFSAERTNFYVELGKRDVEKKVKAMQLYASQARGKGHFRSSEVIRSLATLRGASIGTSFAEGFYLHKFQL